MLLRLVIANFAIILVVCLAGCQSSSGEVPTVLRSDPQQPWDLSDFQPWKVARDSEPKGASGAGRKIRHVEFENRGKQRSLVVHFPSGQHASKSLPCVLVPPAGSNLVTGQKINGDTDLLNKYLRKKMVVVTYELNGALHKDNISDQKKFREAYLDFVYAQAGLENSQNAFEYAVRHIDQVNPKLVFVAGHSSGGSHALLFAAHEPRLAGCVAYCPDTNMGDYTDSALDFYGRFLPGLDRFVVKASPQTRVQDIQCPVLIFAARDDDIVDFDATESFCRKLRETNIRVIYRWTDEGGHFESYQSNGLDAGVDWITRIANR